MRVHRHMLRTALVSAVAIFAGLAGVWLGSTRLSPPAVAAGLSPVEELVAKSEINQQITLYTLLLDGDGVAKRDVRTWANRLFTEDAVFETYGGDGKLRSRQSGREDIYQQNMKTAPFPPEISNRHFNVATYFDELTPTTAKVRTITTVLTVTRRQATGCVNLGDDGCGGKAIRVTSFTYHDTFTKTADGWKKSHSVIHSDI